MDSHSVSICIHQSHQAIQRWIVSPNWGHFKHATLAKSETTFKSYLVLVQPDTHCALGTALETQIIVALRMF